MKFSVRITRTITTYVEVKAKHATAAREQIKKHGLQKAINDYRVLDEEVRISLGYAIVMPYDNI